MKATHSSQMGQGESAGEDHDSHNVTLGWKWKLVLLDEALMSQTILVGSTAPGGLSLEQLVFNVFVVFLSGKQTW